MTARVIDLAERRARAAAPAQPSASPKLSLQELKEAVSMGLDLADYDARLQQSRMKRKLEDAAKLLEEEKKTVTDRIDDNLMINLTADGFNELMARRRAREAAEAAERDRRKDPPG